MTTVKRAVLFFDTSKTGAGALMSTGRPLPTLLLVRRVRYGTTEGDAALEELFQAAAALKAAGFKVAVSAEQPMGYDPRFQSGRALANGHIGVLKEWARKYGIPWGGVYAPATAKATLGQSGHANKETMIYWANRLYGEQLPAAYGRKLVYTGDARTCDEHCADAIGGAMAAINGKPYVVRKTGGRTHKKQAEKTDLQKGGRLF